ncbi:MAG: FAD-dependent oxidoreductase [Gammaproteobacteria bacterium]|nr:FAD-dependent oxidoreductase [Gammaproteobacteria bacterium]
MSQQYNAIIIGAGVIGAATAFAMARQGMKVLCVDALPAAGYGSTSGSCAIIRPYYSTFHSCAIANESHYYWRDWSEYLDAEDELGHVVYHNTGILAAKTDNNHNMAPILAILDEVGASYVHLDVNEMKAKLPIINTDSFHPARRPEDDKFGLANGQQINGGVYFPDGGYISDPQLSTHNLQRAAEAKGAQFLFNAKVTQIRQTNGHVVGITLANGESINAPVVVNVAGPHSSKINTMAGVIQDMKISTRAMRHEVSHVPAPAGFDIEKNGMVTSDSDIHVYTRPETGNHILVGSEDPECDPKVFVDADDYDENFTDQWRVQALRAAQRIPGITIPNRPMGVVALYDVTEDWAPIYDKSSLAGFYMAIGTSGNQFKNAPIAGEMMAQLIAACENGQDHDHEPIDFTLQYTGHSFSIGEFSRNRKINPNSTGTVLG